MVIHGMSNICASVECLCNSPRRLGILGSLVDEQMEVRELMDALDSPRSTVQRNLSVLEEEGWIDDADSGYTASHVGKLLYSSVSEMNERAEKVEHLAPFLDAVDSISELEIESLSDFQVHTPEPNRPDHLRKRLLTVFRQTEMVRGAVPVLSSLTVEDPRSIHGGHGLVSECIISLTALEALKEQSQEGDVDEITSSTDFNILIYDGQLPYGLFISEGILLLVAYNDLGRIQAVVESTNENAITWGEQVYEERRRASELLHELDY